MLGLPTPPDSRIALRLTSDAQRHVRHGHPWVFDQSIVSENRRGETGDLGVVFDNKRKFVAIGLYDADSPIRLKILHQGRPVKIDTAFWEAKVSTAIGARARLLADGRTNAYRLANGENDGLPGFVVDQYADAIVIKLYSGAWFPFLGSLVEVLIANTDATTVVLRLSRNVQMGETFGCSDGMVLELVSDAESESARLERGANLPGRVSFVENGLLFEADLIRGQKTGHFLDQRENRSMVAELAEGKSVLDVFSCTGGFALNAAAGGAKSVHAVDLAPEAISSVKANFVANSAVQNVAGCTLTTAVADAFEHMEALAESGKRFDIVVIDPPSFAQKKLDIGVARRAYRRLTSLGLALLERDGVLVQASCSSRVTAEDFFEGVAKAAATNGFALNPFRRTEHAVDHPASFAEGHYLKAVYARPTRSSAARDQRRSNRS